MDKYQRGKIYTIRCHNDETMIYVGSTIETLAQRMAKHRCSSKTERCKNTMIYQAVNGNWDEWYIELYELCPCNSKEELGKREGEIIREIGTLNKIIAGRSHKQYRDDNREKLAERRKVYYENNREKLAEQKKVYYEDNREEIAEQRKVFYNDNREKLAEKAKDYYEDNKSKIIERAKEYYEDNKEKVLQRLNIYRENNREKIAERNAEIVVCQYCGCNSVKHHLPRHQRTAKCISSREST